MEGQYSRTMTALFLIAAMALAALPAGEPPAAPSAGPPSARIGPLAWMAGLWQGREGPLEMEELWTAPRGGSMLGLHRDVRGDRTVSFEFFRIAEDKDGVIYFASPQGRPATPFRLVETGQERAVFANPEHDFPQRILYWKDAEGALHARIEGTREGKPASHEWQWTRAK